MKIFKYSFIPKIIYRYAIIPADLIILIYLLLSLIGIMQDWKFIFPLIINLVLLYYLNRFYIKMYKTFPFTVKINNEEMLASDFVIGDREIKIKLLDITEISGGIFSGRAYMPLYITTDSVKLGISPHMKDFNKLLTIILSNISKELYEELLDSIKKIAHPNKPKKKT